MSSKKLREKSVKTEAVEESRFETLHRPCKDFEFFLKDNGIKLKYLKCGSNKFREKWV